MKDENTNGLRIVEASEEDLRDALEILRRFIADLGDPPLDGPAEIDADQLAEHAGIDALRVISRKRGETGRPDHRSPFSIQVDSRLVMRNPGKACAIRL